MGRRTKKTRPPPASPPTRPEEAPVAAACWFVVAKRTCRAAFRGRNWRAVARAAVLEAIILNISLEKCEFEIGKIEFKMRGLSSRRMRREEKVKRERKLCCYHVKDGAICPDSIARAAMLVCEI